MQSDISCSGLVNAGARGNIKIECPGMDEEEAEAICLFREWEWAGVLTMSATLAQQSRGFLEDPYVVKCLEAAGVL